MTSYFGRRKVLPKEYRMTSPSRVRTLIGKMLEI
jgi:hypothetical protein